MEKTFQNNQNQEPEYIPLEGDNIFGVFDLGCAVALMTAGFELLTLDRINNPKKIKFIFRSDQGIRKTADDFWDDKLEQKTRSFWDNAKNLKNRLYSDK